MALISHAQIQLMEAKRQLETQVALHQKTKELLNVAQLEVNALRLQLGSSNTRLALGSPPTPTIRGWCTCWHMHTHVHTLPYRVLSSAAKQCNTYRNAYMLKCIVFKLVINESYDLWDMHSKAYLWVLDVKCSWVVVKLPCNDWALKGPYTCYFEM